MITFSGRRRARWVLVGFVLTTGTTPVRSQPSESASQVITASDLSVGEYQIVGWQFSETDEVDGVTIDPAESVDLPSGEGWFRRELQLDSTLVGVQVGVLVDHIGAAELYVDGRLMHRYGEIGDPYTGYLEHGPRPVSFQSPGAHLLTIRYVDPNPGAFHRRKNPTHLDVRLSLYETSLADFHAWRTTVSGLRIACTLVPLSIAVIHLFLFAAYRPYRLNLDYAVTGLAFSAAAYTAGTAVMSSDPDLMSWLEFFAGHFTILTIVLGLRFWYAFYTAEHRSNRMIPFFLLWIAADLMIWFDIPSYDGGPVFFIALGLTFVEMAAVIVGHLRANPAGAWIHITSFGGLAFGILVAALQLTGLAEIVSDERTAAVFAGLFVLAPPMLTMSISLARGFGGLNIDLERRLVEVEELSRKTIEQERRIRNEEVRRKVLEEELQAAHDLQMGLMPTTAPQILGLDIAGRCVPASQVGGDFYQYHERGDRLLISLADVTGHAMEAAIPAVMFSGVLESEVQRDHNIEVLLSSLNQTMHRTLHSRTLVCCALIDISGDGKRIAFSNSGCPNPYHYVAATGEIHEVEVNAYPLGVRPDTLYASLEHELGDGDRIILCSDGIPETGNAEAELFDYDRTRQILLEACRSGLSAGQTIDRLFAEVNAHKGETEQTDDTTCIVIHATGDAG